MTYFGDSAPGVSATVITLGVIAYLVFGLRVHTRLRNKAWGIDDWCMTIAMVPFTVLTVACLAGSFKGIGVHEHKLAAAEKVEGLMFFFLFEVFYCAAIIPIKLSISAMLMRIAWGKKKYIHSLYVVSVMFTAMNLIALFYIIFQCSPVRYAWDTSGSSGKCNPAKTLADIYYATTAINIATDWFCAILPVPILWNVQLNRNAKLSVGFILSLGALASLSACIRLVYTVNLTNSTDFLYGISDVLIWGYAENAIGVIVGCIATLRPLFRRVFNLGGDSVPDRSTRDHHTMWPASHARHGGRDEEWVVLHEPTKSEAKRSTYPLQDSESKESILGSDIKITKTILQSVTYQEEEEERRSRSSRN
ncbi:hypothetical protein P153DRAFT_319184 [Dothidotthia symphoricarpi CBS 119687]|uniref:Rhodopsin domain-containing protein n=1 Tax=Dothidotthia symphoricarpi CBS 119687 TaxID=1392245 RepID=A0A6A6A9X6_9PLEO|nr:uncharacterized protein P153DRAFT_319184 [Dothidotthia symphoricarpi CBS 119687]KAF2128003.1 hypothetical protein P153DRAFT_319184 [Dothidotthia symphoricarpi CBS 119687]